MENYMNCTISGIPSLIVNPPGIPKATVLLYHGWASNNESYLFFASLVSNWGFKVIIPELPHHGVRGSLNYFDTKVLEENFWDVVLQGVEEVEKIVSTLTESENRISIIGHSTGGFIAGGAFAKIPCLQSAIVINGSCAWVKFEETYREKGGRPPLTDTERHFLEEHDPLTRISLGREKTLLLLHGKEDSVVPIDSQRYFINEMSTAPEEHLKCYEFSGVNHQITLKMLEKSKEWLSKLILN